MKRGFTKMKITMMTHPSGNYMLSKRSYIKIKGLDSNHGADRRRRLKDDIEQVVRYPIGR
jgi:hypothetical protein